MFSSKLYNVHDLLTFNSNYFSRHKLCLAPFLRIQIGKHELEEKILPAKAKPVQNGILNNQEERQRADESTHAAFATKGEMIVNPLSGLEVTNKKLGWDDHLYGSSSLMKSREATDNGDIIQIPTKKMTRDNIGSDSNQENSTSILDKLFGSSLTVNTSSNFREVI